MSITALFRRTPKSPVTVPHGHLALVRDDGQVVDLGAVTQEDIDALGVIVEYGYASGHRRVRVSAIMLGRVRGMVRHWRESLK